MNSRGKIRRVKIIVWCLLQVIGLGCANDCGMSVDDCQGLRAIMELWAAQCQYSSEKEFVGRESEIDSLSSRLNAFCQTHKIGRSTLQAAINIKAMPNGRDRDVVYVLGSHGGEHVGVVFMFEGKNFVQKVGTFYAIE